MQNRTQYWIISGNSIWSISTSNNNSWCDNNSFRFFIIIIFSIEIIIIIEVCNFFFNFFLNFNRIFNLLWFKDIFSKNILDYLYDIIFNFTSTKVININQIFKFLLDKFGLFLEFQSMFGSSQFNVDIVQKINNFSNKFNRSNRMSNFIQLINNRSRIELWIDLEYFPAKFSFQNKQFQCSNQFRSDIVLEIINQFL